MYLAKVRFVGDDGIERTFIVSEIKANTDAQAYARLCDLRAADGKRVGQSRAESVNYSAIELPSHHLMQIKCACAIHKNR